jgi:nickel transport protein
MYNVPSDADRGQKSFNNRGYRTMKWHKLLGLLAAGLITSSFGSLKALALSVEEVQAKLQPIPVFAISNDQGRIWTVANENNNQLPVLFISLADAQKYQQELEKNKPELKDKLSVTVLSLGEAYEQVRGQNNQQQFSAAFVPTEQQVQLATQLLQQQGQQVEQFQGVPVFFPTVTENQKEGYLVIKVQGENGTTAEGIPFFFDKEQLQKLIERIQQQQGANKPPITIKVIPLENLISIFEKENDEAIKSIILFRSQESDELIKKIQQNQNQSQPTPSPQQ